MSKGIIIRTFTEPLDILDLIRGYAIALQPAGRNLKALCPFHKERTPSFVVSPSRQTFHCFGCGKGGDAITFVKLKDRISYEEAAKKLEARVTDDRQIKRAVEILRKKAALERFAKPQDVEDIIQHLARSVKSTPRVLGAAFDNVRDTFIKNARTARAEVESERMNRKSGLADVSWPPHTKLNDHAYREAYRSARNRTRARLAGWMSRLRAQCNYPRYSLDTIPPNDPLAIDMFIHQPKNDFMNLPAWLRGFYWPNYITILRKMRPASVMDIAIAHALSQERPILHGVTAKYLSLIASGRSAPVDRLIEPITRTTRGLFVFSEQIMEACWSIAGFSVEESNRFRRVLLLLNETKLMFWRDRFLRGARLRGVSQRRAMRIFDICALAGGYNVTSRSQSLEYANLNYWVAYMKTYFPRVTSG